MEGPLLEYYLYAADVLRNAFATQHALYTNVGITVGMAAVAAFVIVCLLIKLLGELVMAAARTIQQRLLSFEEVRTLNAKALRREIKHAVGSGTISRDAGDKMLEHVAKTTQRWDLLPKKRVPLSRPAAMVKAEIIARLPEEALIPKPQKSQLGRLFANLKPATA